MSERNDDIVEVTRAQRLWSNVIAGVFVVGCGIFLLVAGLAFDVSVSKILLASVLATVGLVLLVTGLIQKNSVSLWLSFAFLTPALVEILVKSGLGGYGVFYPLYIAIPAISSLMTMMMTHEWRDHIFVILIFGVAAAVFGLQSSGAVGWSVVIPILVMFVGAIIIYFAIKNRKEEDNDEL